MLPSETVGPMVRRAWLVLVLAAPLLAGCGGMPPAPVKPGPDVSPVAVPIRVSELTPATSRYGIYELSIAHDDALYANPWTEVRLAGTLTGPAGEQYAVDGFYYDTDEWRLRFSPPRAGPWRWSLVLNSTSGSARASGSFTTAPAQRRGPLQRHPANPFRLVYADGALFNAIGIGDCILDVNNSRTPLDNWGHDGGFRNGAHTIGRTVDMTTYLRSYGAAGAGFNLFRWSVDNCAFRLWEHLGEDGNRYSIDAGYWGDELVQALQHNGFRIWMTLLNKLPYPHGMDAQASLRDYIRYVVARYGAYIDIWELTNEAHVSDGWIKYTASVLRYMDPYDHLITTSWERPQLYAIEINTPHWYQKEPELESDRVTARRIAAQRKWNKPIIFGEQGNSRQNWDDRSALRMRLRSWTAFFEEAALIFWNSSFAKDFRADVAASLYIGPEERTYIRVLQDFTADADAGLRRFSIKPDDPGIRAYGLRSGRMILAYLHHFSDHRNPIRTSVPIELPAPSRVTWVDPETGALLETLVLPLGKQFLQTPDFTVDLALKIELGTEQ